MRKYLLVFLAVLFLSDSLFAISGRCNGVCPECKMWMPLLKTKATELKEEYLAAEQEISTNYNDKILPLLDERAALLKTLDRLQAEMWALEQIMAARIEEVNKDREYTMRLYTPKATKNSKNKEIRYGF